jgi:hypothetical protein
MQIGGSPQALGMFLDQPDEVNYFSQDCNMTSM